MRRANRKRLLRATDEQRGSIKARRVQEYHTTQNKLLDENSGGDSDG